MQDTYYYSKKNEHSYEGQADMDRKLRNSAVVVPKVVLNAPVPK